MMRFAMLYAYITINIEINIKINIKMNIKINIKINNKIHINSNTQRWMEQTVPWSVYQREKMEQRDQKCGTRSRGIAL